MNHKEKTAKSVLDSLLDERSPLESRKNKDKMFLAVRIADLIRERNLSKSAFAGLMEQKPSVVSKWLSGTHNFTAETLSEIAFKFGLTLPELLAERPATPVYQRSINLFSKVTRLPASSSRMAELGENPFSGIAGVVLGRDTNGISRLKTETKKGVTWISVDSKDFELDLVPATIVAGGSFFLPHQGTKHPIEELFGEKL